MPWEQRAVLVGADESAVARDVGYQDCREAPLDMSGHNAGRLGDVV
jgi:hypothetical protein